MRRTNCLGPSCSELLVGAGCGSWLSSSSVRRVACESN